MSQFIPTSGLLVFTVCDTFYKVIMFTLGVLKGVFGIARVSISTDDQRNALVTLLREVAYFSLWKKKQLALTVFCKQNIFIKTEWKRKGSLVLSCVLVCKRCASVNFSHVSLEVYMEFLLPQMSIILIVVICSVLLTVDCVPDKLELE